MSPRERAGLALGLALLAAAALFVALRLRVSDAITHFLPGDADAAMARVSRALTRAPLSRAMVLAVSGRDLDDATAAATELAARLSREPEVAYARTGVDPTSEAAVRELYLPRTSLLVSDDPAHALAPRLTDDGLRAEARSLRARLALPTGSLYARLAPRDPFMAFAATLARLRHLQGDALTLHDGHLVARDGRHAVILAATRHPAFDSARQRPLLAALDRHFAAVNAAHHGRLTLRQSGAHRIAVTAEAKVRADATRLSTLSSLGVVLLFLAVFRSLRSLVLAFAPLAGAVLLATSACLALYGAVHGLTLGFGSTLLGVCVDYPVHLLTRHALRRDDETARDSLGAVWPSLRLGALTSVAGFAALAWAGFPGLREIAVFSCVGVIGALLTTRLVVAPLLPRARDNALQQRLADALHRALDAVTRAPSPRIRAPPRARGLLARGPRAAALGRRRARPHPPRSPPSSKRTPPSARWSPPSTRAASWSRAATTSTPRSASTTPWPSRSVRRCARTSSATRARSTTRSGAKTSSARTGRCSRPTRRCPSGSTARSPPRIPRGAFAPFTSSLREPSPAPLTWSDLRVSLGAALDGFRLDLGEGPAFVTLLSGVRDAEALRRRFARVEGVDYFDQREFLREAYATWRRRTMTVVAMGLALVLAMMAWRYRASRRLVAAFAPALLAGLASLALVGALGIEANLLHLLGLLLVLSMGADYGVFMADARDTHEARDTLLSLAVACATTVMSFGLLALSTTPALRAVGLTTAVGMALSLALAVSLAPLHRRG
ncbi:MAG: MMPL family transporter [Polyangiales bacterium]